MSQRAWPVLCCLLWLSAPVLAAIEIYEFSDPALETRYYQLIEILRCPKCQNQNIKDSNAPLSADLRARVHEMLEAGHSDAEIVTALKDRYGNFISYLPPLNLTTLLLWFGPLLGVALAAFLVARWIRHNQRQGDVEALSEAERQQLATVLGSDEDAGR